MSNVETIEGRLEVARRMRAGQGMTRTPQQQHGFIEGLEEALAIQAAQVEVLEAKAAAEEAHGEAEGAPDGYHAQGRAEGIRWAIQTMLGRPQQDPWAVGTRVLLRGPRRALKPANDGTDGLAEREAPAGSVGRIVAHSHTCKAGPEVEILLEDRFEGWRVDVLHHRAEEFLFRIPPEPGR